MTTTQFEDLLKPCKTSFWIAFFFSFILNGLLLTMSIYSLQVLDRVLSSASLDTLLMLSLIMVAVFIVIAILQMLRSFIFMSVNRYLDSQLSAELLDESVTMQSQAVGSQHLRDLSALKGFISSPSLTHLFDAPWSCIYIAVIFMIHPVPGWIILASAILLFGLAYFNDSLSKEPFSKANEAQVTSMASVDELTRNAELIRAMGMTPHMLTKWQEQNVKSIELSDKGASYSNVISSITKGIRLSIQMITMAVGAVLVIENQMSAGGIIAISILSGKALGPFDAAMGMWKSVVNARKSYARVKETIDNRDEAIDLMPLPEPQGQIGLESLLFASQDRLIIKGISLQIPKGECVAILGPNGAGKTTLMRLILGVLPATKGKVSIDGADIQTWNKDQLGPHIGYLPQDIELFAGSVQDNISRMKKDEDPESVIAAAKFTGVHDMILQLPQGYNTVLGVGGRGLSAGQRQQIALARAFYGQPKIVALDEPNSNLDEISELSLLRTLKNAKEAGITCLVISHRPNLLREMHRILILQNGETKAYMTQDEFLEKSKVLRDAKQVGDQNND